MGQLYIVATPIGNLEDITIRAVSTLEECECVACEDTRQSRKLLTRYGITARLLSCHRHNEERCIPRILEFLREDTDVCYLSDAGTPGVSDPGSRLVRAVRTAGYRVTPIPGVSAVSTIVSVSGIAGRGWWFEGFLPPKGRKRVTRIAELAERGDPFVLYESPRRFAKLAAEVSETVPDWSVVIGREMTKSHEQIVEVSVKDLSRIVESGEIPCKGEFVILAWSGKKR